MLIYIIFITSGENPGESLRESGQPIGRLRKTCKKDVPVTLPISFGRVDTSIATESVLNLHFIIYALVVNHAHADTQRDNYPRGVITTLLCKASLWKPNKIKTTDIELSITVTDDKPIYHSPRRLPFTERDIVDKQIDEWIQNDVIEPCSSAYASQVLVVRKKDGSPRVCIDFRKLNRVLVKDHYPLPLIEDILDKLQDTRVFSTIDLRLTGYFRKFIPAYSVIAKPLSDLLRKDTLFNFDVKQKASFDELKRLLCQKPVLGLPRANGQVERINRTIIPVLSKMSEDDPTKWFKHVPSLQEVLNSTFQRSINTTPFELLFGTQINNKTDLRIQQLIDEQLQLEFNENRELLRKKSGKNANT
ncbi:transposon Ty3-I Gag-Pol polyprotein [Trichonephila clavipes]|nr:transposon Ty3-I Gag-Pol polyprotein [Trichonephila clavipes]